MDKEIFKLIGRPEEKSKLWSDLAQARTELHCKGAEDSICRLQVQLFHPKSETLECAYSSSVKLKEDEEYLGHFSLGGEKYYFRSTAKSAQGKVLIPVPTEIYLLQRRQNYRVRIPDGYPAFYNIVLVNEKQQKITGQLVDLSSQGCRVICRLNAPIMKIGDTVTGELTIGTKSSIEIKGILRHLKVDESNQLIQTFGIEFTPLPAILENKLFAITMEIHKQHFRR